MHIHSDHRLTGAFYQSYPGAEPRPLSHYDDGDGGLYVYGNEFGAVALIRAGSWETAYGIAEDEYMDAATMEDIISDFGEDWQNAEGFDESYGFRPNGPNKPGDSGIFAKSHYEWMREFPAALGEEITYTTESWV